jgi:cleavage stimulation factor subunit 3
VELWKKYISWEKSNPLRTEDQTTITKRVMYAYEQCLLCMGHHPDIWYEAALYLELSSKLLQEKGVCADFILPPLSYLLILNL